MNKNVPEGISYSDGRPGRTLSYVRIGQRRRDIHVPCADREDVILMLIGGSGPGIEEPVVQRKGHLVRRLHKPSFNLVRSECRVLLQKQSRRAAHDRCGHAGAAEHEVGFLRKDILRATRLIRGMCKV